MTVLVAVPPEPILGLDQVKRQLRIEPEDTTDDDLLPDLVAAATAQIDGPAGWLGRALGLQTLELVRPAVAWGCGIALPFGPVREIVSVKQDGAILPSSLYRLDASGRLRVAAGQSIPSGSSEPDALRIQYKAGWPVTAAASDVGIRWTGPAAVRHALLMMVARLFAARGEPIAGTLVEDPAIAALLTPHRIFSL